MLKKLRKRKAIDPRSQITETEPDKPVDTPPKRQESKNMETNDRKKSNQKRIAKRSITSTETTSLKQYYTTCSYKRFELNSAANNCPELDSGTRQAVISDQKCSKIIPDTQTLPGLLFSTPEQCMSKLFITCAPKHGAHFHL